MARGANFPDPCLGRQWITGYDQKREASLTEAFLGRRVDGILLTGVTHGNGFGTDLKHAGIPVVETWDMSSRPIYMVAGFGNEKAGVAVAAYMLSMGHRKYSANAYIREGGREEGRGVRRTNVIGTVARNCQSE